MRVAIIMGSTSDLPKVEPAIGILKEYGVAVDVRCLSAHRAHAGAVETWLLFLLMKVLDGRHIRFL